MPVLIPVLGKDEIDRLVTAVAQKISSDYRDRELILIGVLKGAFVFLSDLMRKMSIPAKVDFVRVASYGSDTSSCGKIQLIKELEIDIRNKDVLVVEDIVDTGCTFRYLMDYVRSRSPRTIKVCALIDKRERRESEVVIDYVCHVVEQGFLVGYGLDYAEDYRYLPGIYHLKF
jgi:hypoxanthine phosphoribosyltransferase